MYLQRHETKGHFRTQFTTYSDTIDAVCMSMNVKGIIIVQNKYNTLTHTHNTANTKEGLKHYKFSMLCDIFYGDFYFQ